MKKRIATLIMAAGLLLLVSCNPNVNVTPAEPTGSTADPTKAELPTATPEAEISPQVTDVPEPAVTGAVEPTVIPTPVLKPTISPQPTLTPVPEPTERPEPTEDVPEPTKEAVPTEEAEQPTDVPEPTEYPEPTEPEPTQIPEETPEPTPGPTPVVNPELLVNHGWQKTVTIDGKYTIVFPEIFRESAVIKDGKELHVTYTCVEETGIEFRIAYLLQQTLEEVENAILSKDGTILEGSLGERRVVLEWKENGYLYRGVLSAEQYPGIMLGDFFGEEDWISGVMQVTFAYPEERREEFETAKFNYYLKQNRED